MLKEVSLTNYLSNNLRKKVAVAQFHCATAFVLFFFFKVSPSIMLVKEFL